MPYRLMPYQERAARKVLDLMAEGKDDYRQRHRLSSFALSSTTGSGKTVIAAAVIEGLFVGSDTLGVESDPSAVVLWVTDDPSLNEQTRHRMLAAADRLRNDQLVTIGNGDTTGTFDQPKFEAGHVYFLNVQKLRSGSTWVRRGDNPPRTYTLWDTLRNTINDDRLTLYVVIDEAHKGMRRATTADGEVRATIVQRIVNGHDDVPAAPVVWGISATIERFETAMAAAHMSDRVRYPAVTIDPVEVQESGLLKDTIILDFPNEQGDFETTLLRSATREILAATERWREYATEQALPDPVVPLMVVQVPNRPSPAQLKRYLDTVYEEWPDLRPDAFANVFGEHTDVVAGSHTVPYVPPQDVQDATRIRVLLAKDAVSTGWDCPRAEVLFSLRPATDRTHITQLLGRMVRTPLAHRTDRDPLNAVTCYLPHFNRDTAVEVADRLTGRSAGDDETEPVMPGRRVMFAPVELRWNPTVDETLRDFLAGLPSEQKPNPLAKPIVRLLSLAAALAIDELLPTPDATARETLYAVLDGQLAQHRAAVEAEREEIVQADLIRVTASMLDQSLHEEAVTETADARTVDDAFRVATRTLGRAIAGGYEAKVADHMLDDDGEPDYLAARAEVAALMRLPEVLVAVEREADHLTRRWLDETRVAVASLPEERRAAYDAIRAQARVPERVPILVPASGLEDAEDKHRHRVPTRRLHVLSDGAGEYPIGQLREGWERSVVDTELGRPNVVAWYRNPSAATKSALRVPYQRDGVWKSLQPDFVFIAHTAEGELVASIVDPHGHHLSDAIPKLIGLADFAERYADEFQRVDSVARNSANEAVLLDMKDPDVRSAVRNAESALGLYDGPHARAYL